MVFGEHYPFRKDALWGMTTIEMINYCKGALMHYEMNMNQHAMSEDAGKSIRKQLNALWDYMFPTDKTYARNARETLDRVKNRYGID